MNSNWTCRRLVVSSTTNCLMMIKVLAMLLVLCTLVAGQGSKTIPSRKLVDLAEDNWRLMLRGEWMVEFFAPWCPACKNLAPTWERFATSASEFNVKVAVIDVTTSPSLSGRFFVTALPTIYHVLDGEFRHYRGSRDADSLYKFIKDKQWKNIVAISSWKKPDTIHMSILSYFFKLSHSLKDLNMYLQDEYNLPTWASYTLFAFATIFVGAVLGLFLVFLVDSLYPPKKLARQSFVETRERIAREGVEDLDHDELEDDNELNQNEANEEANEETTNEDEDEDEDQDEDEDDEQGQNSNEENIENQQKNSNKSQAAATVKNTDKTSVNKKTTKELNYEDDKSSANNNMGSEMRKRNKSRKAD